MAFNTRAEFADAMQANLGFTISQTSKIEAQVYRTKYPDLDYSSLIPVDTTGGEWIKTVTYFSFDGAGAARWINGNGKDFPTVGFQMAKEEKPVYMAGIGYDYGFEEINQARMLGISLDSEKAALARRAYEQFVYDLAFTGDDAKGFSGFFDYPGVPVVALTADGTGTSALWSTKTGDQISRDVNGLLTGMFSATKTVELADTLVLPVERLQTAASTRLADTTMTVLDWIKQTNVYTAQTGRPLTIVGKRGLLTAGVGGTARMIAYRRSPEVLKLHIPMPHRFLEVQVQGLQFQIPGVFRVGGLDIRLPYAVRYGDGL